jgi:hypothetical protein
MDSISGVSEENQVKRDKVRFVQEGDMKRTRLDELPKEERERIKAYMEMMGTDEEPEMYLVDMKVEFDEIEDIPVDFLLTMYRDAIVDNEYEEAQELGDEIKKRGYSIEITEKRVTLTYEGRDDK